MATRSARRAGVVDLPTEVLDEDPAGIHSTVKLYYKDRAELKRMGWDGTSGRMRSSK